MAGDESDPKAEGDISNSKERPSTEGPKSPVPDGDKQAGNSALEPVFADPADPRWALLVPYVNLIDAFRSLAEEYPSLSMNWAAESAYWWVWPLSNREVGQAQDVPSEPGGELHAKRIAAEAAERLLCFFPGRSEAAKLWFNPARDRWLKPDGIKPWEAWFYAIREFWLAAREEAEAAGRDLEIFKKLAQEQGYVPGTSTALGRPVWSTMVTQRKCLSEVFKELRLSTGEEIDRFEDPAGWIQNGEIPNVFKASEYFCGVLAARRVGELKDSQGSGAHLPSGLAAGAEAALKLEGQVPHFVFRYGPDFPALDQEAIEAVRQEANKKFAAKSVNTFEEWISAHEEWLSDLLYGAAPVIGRVAIQLRWSADNRRDVLKDFMIQAAHAGRLTIPRIQRFFAPPRAKELDNALFPRSSPKTAQAEDSTSSADAQPRASVPPNPVRLNTPARQETAGPTNKANEVATHLIQPQDLPAPSNESLSEQLENSSQMARLGKERRTPERVLLEYKVLNKIRTHELVAEKLGLERSVYFDLKAGRRVSEETYVKAALVIGCSPDDLKP